MYVIPNKTYVLQPEMTFYAKLSHHKWHQIGRNENKLFFTEVDIYEISFDISQLSKSTVYF